MRIGFAAERMLTGFGVDLCIDQLATGLTRRGHDVTVYCSVADEVYRNRPYRIQRAPVHATDLMPVMDRRGAIWSELVDSEVDVVEVHAFPFFSMLPRLRIPSVAVDHGVSLTSGMSLWRRANFGYVSWMLYNRYLPKATRIVTISDFLRRQMPARVRLRAEVIGWGSDHYWRPVPGQEALAYRRSKGISDDTVLALYVGRLNHTGQPYKGVAELLGHIRALQGEGLPAGLLCVGFGSREDAAAIRDAGGVAVLTAPAEEMPLAYSAADLFVTCSHWEGFGLPLLEAQRFGRPSVAYAVGAHPEIAVAGETAALVDRPERFREEWRSLVLDPGRRESMGSAAMRHAEGFSWERAVDEHEAVLQAAVPAARVAAMPAPAAEEDGVAPLVSVVVLTYQPERPHLEACLDSVLASEHPRVEVVLVDNGSANGVARELAAGRPGVKFVQMGRNAGFSAGINRGVLESTGSLVFILNPDAHVEPDTIGLLVDAARRRPEAIGFAPKMVFAHDPDLIDAVGTGIDPLGAAFNRGIGQLDIGQYDMEEPVAGCCFGAALIRRQAFHPARVGPLDEAYFLYYEDIDWCLRATLRGEDLWTVPAARVHHIHSATARNAAYAFKYRLIQRNLLYTVFKNFERRHAMHVYGKLSRRHLRNVLLGGFRGQSLRILAEAWLGVFRYWNVRLGEQKRRTRADVDAIKLGVGEASFFDPVEYAPIYQLETLHAMLRRLWTITADERWRRALAYVEAALNSPLRYRPVELRERLDKVAGPLPKPVLRFFEELQHDPGMILPPRRSAAAEAAAAGPLEASPEAEQARTS
jgi:GT2 family glycosyltransferase/glycosyltransferase involved in cell wall biosynthesis